MEDKIESMKNLSKKLTGKKIRDEKCEEEK